MTLCLSFSFYFLGVFSPGGKAVRAKYTEDRLGSRNGHDVTM
jgi:hypothetical protein